MLRESRFVPLFVSNDQLVRRKLLYVTRPRAGGRVRRAKKEDGKGKKEKEGQGENGSAYRAGATAFTVPVGRDRETIITSRGSFDVLRRVRTPPRDLLVGVRVVVDGHAHRKDSQLRTRRIHESFRRIETRSIRVHRRSGFCIHPRRGFGIRGKDLTPSTPGFGALRPLSARSPRPSNFFARAIERKEREREREKERQFYLLRLVALPSDEKPSWW